MTRGLTQQEPSSAGMPDDQLYAEAVQGDVSAWNRLGVQAESAGDFVRATAMYYGGLMLFKEKEGEDDPVSEQQARNRAVQTVNCRRAMASVVVEDHPALEAAINQVEADLAGTAEGCGFDEPFASGLRQAARHKAFFLGQLHGYAPFLSLILVSFLVQFLQSFALHCPRAMQSLGPGMSFFRGLDNIGFCFFAALLLIFLPAMSKRWVFLKYAGWIVAYFVVEGMGMSAGELLAVLAR